MIIIVKGEGRIKKIINIIVLLIKYYHALILLTEKSK
jgi:hypothetical protein